MRISDWSSDVCSSDLWRCTTSSVTLGGSFNLPHAPVHTVVLPHALAYNAAAAPRAMERIATALGATSAAQGVFDLASANGAPTSLREIGMRADDLDRACDIALQTPRSEEHTSELQSLMRISYAVICLKKKK